MDPKNTNILVYALDKNNVYIIKLKFIINIYFLKFINYIIIKIYNKWIILGHINYILNSYKNKLYFTLW